MTDVEFSPLARAIFAALVREVTMVKNQAHPVAIEYGNLLQACGRGNLLAHLRTFDGGQTLIITDANSRQEVYRLTREWGDPDKRTLSAAVADWLINQGLIKASDLEG